MPIILSPRYRDVQTWLDTISPDGEREGSWVFFGSTEGLVQFVTAFPDRIGGDPQWREPRDDHDRVSSEEPIASWSQISEKVKSKSFQPHEVGE